MSEFPFDSAIIATVISISISLIVLLLREKKLDPEKWKKNTKLSTIEKQLEAYGILLTILHACEEKIKRQGLNERTESTHLLETPKDADNLRKVFSEKRFLLSEEIVKEYLKMEKDDAYFGLSPKEGKESPILANLSRMQELAELHYVNLKDDFKEMTDYEL